MDKMEKAKKAIIEVFDDMEVSQIETKEALTELRDEIDIMLDTLSD